MFFVCGWEVFLEFPFPASVALDAFSHLQVLPAGEWPLSSPQKSKSLKHSQNPRKPTCQAILGKWNDDVNSQKALDFTRVARSFHKFVVKLSGSELDTIMAGDPLFQVCEAYISPNHPSKTRHIVTVVHRIGLPFTWEAHHRLGTNFGKLLVRNHLSNLRFSTSFSEVFLS